jgi:YidC/Oxa1 family membrane protein insertase
MDKKTYIGMTVLFVLVIGYTIFLEKVVWPKHPEWQTAGEASQPAAAQTGSAATEQSMQTLGGPNGSSAGYSGPASATTKPGGLVAVAATRPSGPLVIGSDQAKDQNLAMGISLEPDGAGLDSVILNDYRAVNPKLPYSFQEPYDNGWRALATRDVVINGQTISLADVPWVLEGFTDQSATYGIEIDSSMGQPLVHLSKVYEVSPRGPKKDWDSTSAGYEAQITYKVQNLSHGGETVQIGFDGPTTPPREAERSDDRQIVAGYDKGDQVVDVARLSASDFKPGFESRDISTNSNGKKLLWAGASSLYFAAIVQADNPGQIGTARAYWSNTNPLPDGLQMPAEDRQIAMEFQTVQIKLDPAASAQVPLHVFFGPKVRAMLEGDYYGNYPRGYNQLLVSSTGICALCAVPKLVDLLVDLLGALQWVFHDWGLAIIALVILVRLCLHPITKSSQVSMMKMQKMGPEVERLKKKYGDDKESFSKAQMELYKEMGFTPVLGCLPMFLQMPIWIALYSALQNEIELRQASFLWGMTWIHDLARPDRLINWDAHAFTIPLIGLHVASLNVLPIFMAVVFFLQQRYTPKPPAATPEQESQQKMMQWMSMLFPLFLYSAPSGLNLYILTSTTIGILESKRIRDHIKQKDQEEKEGRVRVETKATRGGKQAKKLEMSAKQEKRGRLARWWAQLQERAEQIRKDAEKRK